MTHWGSVIAVLPAFAIAIHLAQEFGWWWMAALPLACLFGCALGWYRTNKSLCPRCGELFFHQNGPLGPVGTMLPAPKHCQNCELAIPG